MKKICIVGLGNMGSAIAGILKEFYEVVGCEKGDDPNESLKGCDTCILAVKPQSFSELAESISVDLKEMLVVSIMAGVTVENIEKKLGAQKIIRSLPNLPLKVRRAFTIWFANEGVTAEELESAKSMFRLFGEDLLVDSEEKIDLYGTVSGTAPAYYAYIAEQLSKAAENYGLSNEDAERIGRATMIGSALLLDQEGYGPEELRKRISSKGGITQAAVDYLNSKNFDKIFLEAIETAVLHNKKLNN